MYTLELTEADIATIYFSGYRYGWSDALIDLGISEGINTFSEPDIWNWKDAVESDMEGNHSAFPLLDSRSDLTEKLYKLYENIV